MRIEPPAPPAPQVHQAQGDWDAASDSAPDWAGLTEQVACPMCGYSLRGLVEPRCPECGYRFTWPDMLDGRRRLHPYLFEHHPDKNLSSFLRTALGGWRTRRFWTSLHPSQPPRPDRLIRYWGLAMAVYVLSLAGAVLATALLMANQNQVWQAERIQLSRRASPPGSSSRPVDLKSLQQEAEQVYPTSIPVIVKSMFGVPVHSARFCSTLVLPIVWPWLTLVALMLFRSTMRRASITPVHSLRCVLYSMDTPFWFGLLLITISASEVVWTVCARSPSYHDFSNTWVIPLFVPLTCWRLWRAHKFYMRCDHPLAIALVSQFIVCSVVMIGLVRMEA